MSQHLEHMHKEDHKAFQMNSSRSLFSSQSAKEFKESTAASHALQVTQGIVVSYPVARMEASKKLELNEEFAKFLLTENTPNNLAKVKH